MKLTNIAIGILALHLAATSFVKADTLSIVLDISSSTPIVEPNFMRAALPAISEQIMGLPLASEICMMTVGDDKAKPLNKCFVVQRIKDRMGDTAPAYAKSVPSILATYLNDLRANPGKMQGESSISAGFLDASKHFQVGKKNTVIYLTDGMEYQPKIIAWPRDYKKQIPSIPQLDLQGADIVMYGVGQCAQGQETSCATTQQRVVIEQNWNAWLKEHKGGNVKIARL